MMIYCRYFEDCVNLYIYIKNELQGDFIDPPNSPRFTPVQTYDMYMNCTDPVVKVAIVNAFTSCLCNGH